MIWTFTANFQEQWLFCILSSKWEYGGPCFQKKKPKPTVQEHCWHLFGRLLTPLLGHVIMSTPGVKYMPDLNTVMWLVDVRGRGMRNFMEDLKGYLCWVNPLRVANHIHHSVSSKHSAWHSRNRKIFTNSWWSILPWRFRKGPLLHKKTDFNLSPFVFPV